MTKTTIAFCLRPVDKAKLNRLPSKLSDTVRKWLKEYVANPIDLPSIDDKLIQSTLAVDDVTVDKLKALAAEKGVSLMGLVRQVVESKLHSNQDHERETSTVTECFVIADTSKALLAEVAEVQGIPLHSLLRQIAEHRRGKSTG